MPLPMQDRSWPPAELADVLPRLQVWDAWYTGDRKRLESVYEGGTQVGAPDRLVGIRQAVGQLVRSFWGKAVTTGAASATPTVKLHVPIPRDLARVGSFACWADPPQIKRQPVMTTDATGDAVELDMSADPITRQLATYLRDGLIGKLGAGYEIAGALAGMYVRVTRADSKPGRSFVTVVDADSAWPQFAYDELTAVTFWWVISRQGEKVTRHLERHELDAAGNGVVQHAVYEGTRTTLGDRHRDLQSYLAVAALAPVLDVDGYVLPEVMLPTPGLTVRFIPVVRPAGILRGDQIGHALGRSLFENLEPLFDQLDATFTQLFRDIDLAKGRLVVPESMLVNLGKGSGQQFDIDQQIYTMGPNAIGEGAVQATTVAQFAANVADKLQGCQELTERIIAAAGFSTQTFGENEEGGGGTTATEVNQRVTMSAMTRDAMLRLIVPELHALILKMLAVDGLPVDDPETIVVQFPEGAQATPLILAQTAAALRTASAASTRTIVETVHPDWTDTQVTREVQAIADEAAALAQSSQLADPLTLGGGGDAAATDAPAVPATPQPAPAA